MNKPLLVAMPPLLAMMASGCAGQLQVFDADQQPIAGVPFRTAQVFVKKGIRTRHSKGGECAPVNFVETVPLPTGPLYYANAKSAPLAKTAFHIKIGETGTITEVGLDSEPAGAESLKAANDLLKTVLPVIGVSGAVAAATMGFTESNRSAPAPACDTGEDGVRFVAFDEYLKTQERK